MRGVASPEREKSLISTNGATKLKFVDEEGTAIQVMPVDYGFRSGAGRLYQDGYGTVPTNIWGLATDNFKRELRAMRQSVRYDTYRSIAEAAQPGFLGQVAFAAGGAVRSALSRLDSWLEGRDLLGALPQPKDARDAGLTPEECEILDKVRRFALDDSAVIARERRRVEAEGPVDAPWPVKATFGALCWVLDVAYAGRPIQRFWALETVARIPYFSFISMLHLYETLGWWRAGAELRKVHFAEEWNELHHLQIMEALGGDLMWFDRFIAEHAALVYYWMCIGFYMLAPKNAYQFSELVEWHAVDTYCQFFETNEKVLREIPPVRVAVEYYRNEDLYMFDEMQTCSQPTQPRRPECNNMYDVFVNIRDDEIEHVRTMHACQSPAIARNLAQRRRENTALPPPKA